LCQFQVFSWSVTDLEDSSQLPKVEGNNSTHMGQSEPIPPSSPSIHWMFVYVSLVDDSQLS
jgi:hypothetical protein